jgi:hypothetical protein
MRDCLVGGVGGHPGAALPDNPLFPWLNAGAADHHPRRAHGRRTNKGNTDAPSSTGPAGLRLRLSVAFAADPDHQDKLEKCVATVSVAVELYDANGADAELVESTSLLADQLEDLLPADVEILELPAVDERVKQEEDRLRATWSEAKDEAAKIALMKDLIDRVEVCRGML